VSSSLSPASTGAVHHVLHTYAHLPVSLQSGSTTQDLALKSPQPTCHLAQANCVGQLSYGAIIEF